MSDSQTLTLRPPVWALLVAVALGGCFYVYGKNLETSDRMPTTISVSGEGKVSAVPDIAQLTFGIQTGRRQSAKVAISSLQTDMNKVFNAVKKAGVEEKDIANQQFSLSPAYDWTNGQQRLVGYEASQMLLVKVRNLDKVSAVLSAATDAGANQAGDVVFTIDKPETLQTQAREKAVAQAKEKAQALAQNLGMSLGKVKGFSEGNGPMPPTPMYYESRSMKAMDSMAAGSAGVPLPAGQQDVTSTVSITYELK